MNNRTYLSITEVLKLTNQILVESLPTVAFSGEISQLMVAGSGHMYFTLKDEKSQMSAVMWRGDRARIGFEPKAGDSVLCHAKPNVYHGNGKFQMVVSKMTPAGEGLLQKQFLELKNKLEREGLFSDERKRGLPFLPRTIGVVTSATGAVIHDIMVKVQERFPQVPVKLIDVRVQGNGAAKEIADAIMSFQKIDGVDVLIVGRGGGSLEDLWPFNEEVVVRAIFGSKIPVVSAVGHEVDITLSDLVADVRSPTPTAAAEAVVPRRADLLQQLSNLEERLMDLSSWFTPYAQQVDELAIRLKRIVDLRMEEYGHKLKTAEARLALLRPEKYLSHLHSRFDMLDARLKNGIKRLVTDKINIFRQARTQFQNNSPLRTIEQHRQRLDSLMGRLTALHPHRVLDRGYSIAKVNGQVLRSINAIKPGENLEVFVLDGNLLTEVKNVNKIK